MNDRYFITSLYDGSIKGTNEESTAREYAQSEGFFVVDSQTRMWLGATADGDTKVEPADQVG